MTLETQTVDVLAALKSRAKNDALTVIASNDLAGDPAAGIVKRLKIIYTLDGLPHTQTVTEGKALTVPGLGDAPGALVLTMAVYGVFADAPLPAPAAKPLPTTQPIKIALTFDTPCLLEDVMATFRQGETYLPNVLLSVSPPGVKTATPTLSGEIAYQPDGFLPGLAGVLLTGLKDAKEWGYLEIVTFTEGGIAN